jgi:hypothetical protein
MKLSNHSMFGRSIRLAGLVLTAAMSLAYAQGSDSSDASSGDIEGTWYNHVSLRHCGTGAVLRTFPSIGTFHRGQTLIDTTAATSPALRSPGMGKWEKSGPRTYTAVSLALLFDAAGAWTGIQKLSHEITVNRDEISYKSTVEFFDTGGNTTSTGCATAIGNRL